MLVTAVSVLHGCILWVSILIPALHLSLGRGGARAAGQRLSAALVCWLRFPTVTVRPELATKGKRQRDVNNVKCIWNPAFFGGPAFAERVQQQTGILPWPGLCPLFPSENNNELQACAILPGSYSLAFKLRAERLCSSIGQHRETCSALSHYGLMQRYF